uniref:Transmembrane protein n=1 Tax=Solanum tuberosum TaxID=4113 RepID=M1BKL2_SOLTU
MENYRTGVDDGNDMDLIDFDLLVNNLEVWFLFHFPSLFIEVGLCIKALCFEAQKGFNFFFFWFRMI